MRQLKMSACKEGNYRRWRKVFLSTLLTEKEETLQIWRKRRDHLMLLSSMRNLTFCHPQLKKQSSCHHRAKQTLRYRKVPKESTWQLLRSLKSLDWSLLLRLLRATSNSTRVIWSFCLNTPMSWQRTKEVADSCRRKSRSASHFSIAWSLNQPLRASWISWMTHSVTIWPRR